MPGGTGNKKAPDATVIERLKALRAEINLPELLRKVPGLLRKARAIIEQKRR